MRNTVYFDGHAGATPLAVLAVYAIAGVVLTLIIGELRRSPGGRCSSPATA